MSKSSETTTSTTTNSGTTTGGGGTKGGPHPKRSLEIFLLVIILGLLAYNTYLLLQNHQLLLNQQVSR